MLIFGVEPDLERIIDGGSSGSAAAEEQGAL